MTIAAHTEIQPQFRTIDGLEIRFDLEDTAAPHAAVESAAVGKVLIALHHE